MTCEVCGNVGHSGNNCPETREKVAFINNGFRQSGNKGWNNQSRPQGNSNYNSNYNSNQPSFKDLELSQAKINENINKKLMYNNQMSSNKMIETQIAQLAATIPISDSRKILGQPKTSLKSIKMVSTRFDKPLCWENHIFL